MIPKFPEFKILELSDKKDVEKLISKYQTYSDFNFAGTWSWDVRDQMKISQLNENYVIRFINYLTGEPFYTFLGDNNVNDTIEKLLEISKKEGLSPILNLVPSDSVKNVDTKIFKLEEDIDNFDYIYDLEEQKDFKGKKFGIKRREVVNFLKNNLNVEVKILSLQDEDTQKEIVALYEKWAKNKVKKDKELDPDHELVVIKKFFSAAGEFNLISVGIFIDGELVAFSIDELKETEYVVSHIAKANPLFFGLFSFLMKENARIFVSYGKKYLNFEQDLGIPNLRLSKKLFRPAFFLKKYKISYLT